MQSFIIKASSSLLNTLNSQYPKILLLGALNREKQSL